MVIVIQELAIEEAQQIISMLIDPAHDGDLKYEVAPGYMNGCRYVRIELIDDMCSFNIKYDTTGTAIEIETPGYQIYHSIDRMSYQTITIT